MFNEKTYFSIGNFKFLDKIILLNKLKFNNRIFFIPVIDSTNNFLLRYNHTFSSGDVCISECQTNGRGRLNNFWFSPLVGNIYLSMFWNIYDSSITIVNLSVIVSKMIVKTLFNLGVMNIRFKLPNDIYLDNKKISGVLIDVIYNCHGFRKVIIGIGINLSPTYNALHRFNYLNLSNYKIFIDINILIAILINNLCSTMYKLVNFIYYLK